MLLRARAKRTLAASNNSHRLDPCKKHDLVNFTPWKCDKNLVGTKATHYSTDKKTMHLIELKQLFSPRTKHSTSYGPAPTSRPNRRPKMTKVARTHDPDSANHAFYKVFRFPGIASLAFYEVSTVLKLQRQEPTYFATTIGSYECCYIFEAQAIGTHVFYDTVEAPTIGTYVFCDIFEAPAIGTRIFYDTFEAPTIGTYVFCDTFEAPAIGTLEGFIRLLKQLYKALERLIRPLKEPYKAFRRSYKALKRPYKAFRGPYKALKRTLQGLQRAL